MTGRLIYWVAVLAVSLVLVAALILFFDSRDGATQSALATAAGQRA
jgi:hypothetical protein